ncbi:hypothetical protein NQ314_000856 [Rhamnusium bicolor]|uniref:Exoribonuclease phosphorolytic domain-containing protein n=1 Tax=Rhamnusium bicolor TaxID=1586634 RepID=A0AAV8ZU14_9CUCU|nr:hypothetical protein NQ314_000856 [Rhamnusium bicolor]
MPIDHKRINGPDETVPYTLFTKLNTQSLSQQFNKLICNGKRSDCRMPVEHRKIFLKTGVVSQAKGSAYIELGKTKVILCKRRLHQQDAEEKQYSAIMKQSLESTVCRHEFPNFQVDIYALVLHNDGSALSAAITAAGLALSHAGVPMYDLITSVTLGLQQNMKLLDPNFAEQGLCEMPISSNSENDNHGIITISMLHTHEQISQFYQSGNISLEDLNDSLKNP